MRAECYNLCKKLGFFLLLWLYSRSPSKLVVCLKASTYAQSFSVFPKLKIIHLSFFTFR